MARRANDFYPTPAWVTQGLLRTYPPPRGAGLLDPCAGDGAILRELHTFDPDAALYGLELDLQLAQTCALVAPQGSSVGVGDWFTYADPIQAYVPRAAVITNPPFSLAMEFVSSCVARFPYVAMLLRLGFLATRKRSAWINAHPVTQLIVLGARPSFTGCGGTDSQEYAWFVWDRGAPYRVPVSILPIPITHRG